MIKINLLKGNNLETLKQLPDNSVDSIVTDPPYFLTNGSGSGFMGKEWDSISVANAFAEALLKSLSPVWITDAESIALENANINSKKKKTETDINALYVVPKSIGQDHKLSLGTFSVLEIVLTKVEVLALSKELCPSLMTVIESQPENVLYVLNNSFIQNCPNAIAQEIVLRLVTNKICEELKTLHTLMADQKNIDHIEEMIGKRLERKFTNATITNVKNVENIVLKKRYNVTTSSLIESRKIIQWIILSRSVRNAMATFMEIPGNIQILSERFHYRWASEALRVLKPGGHLLAFAGTRTYHPLAKAVESAGFEIRDQIQWIYSTGFPKSLNVQKAAFKVNQCCGCKTKTEHNLRSMSDSDLPSSVNNENEQREVLQQGLPKQSASEYWAQGETVVCRDKPMLEGRKLHRATKGLSDDKNAESSSSETERVCSRTHISCRENAQETSDCNGRSAPHKSQSSGQPSRKFKNIQRPHGALDGSPFPRCSDCSLPIIPEGLGTALKPANEPIVVARKPLEKGLTIAENVLKYGTGAINVDASRISASAEDIKKTNRLNHKGNFDWNHSENTAFKMGQGADTSQGRWPANIILDEVTGCADWSRFFYVAKASKSERNKGLDGMPKKPQGAYGEFAGDGRGRQTEHQPTANFHPTVKPIKLMQYLIKLVTPPNGTVLDPFMGSGSTGVAAKELGFNFVGCELSPEYFEIAEKRING